MRKAYIQPEVELLSLALLEDFLTGSNEPSNDDVTVGGGDGEGNTGAGDDFVSGGDGNNNPGSTENDGNDWEDDGDDDGKWN